MPFRMNGHTFPCYSCKGWRTESIFKSVILHAMSLKCMLVFWPGVPILLANIMEKFRVPLQASASILSQCPSAELYMTQPRRISQITHHLMHKSPDLTFPLQSVSLCGRTGVGFGLNGEIPAHCEEGVTSRLWSTARAVVRRRRRRRRQTEENKDHVAETEEARSSRGVFVPFLTFKRFGRHTRT